MQILHACELLTDTDRIVQNRALDILIELVGWAPHPALLLQPPVNVVEDLDSLTVHVNSYPTGTPYPPASDAFRFFSSVMLPDLLKGSSTKTQSRCKSVLLAILGVLRVMAVLARRAGSEEDIDWLVGVLIGAGEGVLEGSEKEMLPPTEGCGVGDVDVGKAIVVQVI